MRSVSRLKVALARQRWRLGWVLALCGVMVEGVMKSWRIMLTGTHAWARLGVGEGGKLMGMRVWLWHVRLCSGYKKKKNMTCENYSPCSSNQNETIHAHAEQLHAANTSAGRDLICISLIALQLGSAALIMLTDNIWSISEFWENCNYFFVWLFKVIKVKISNTIQHWVEPSRTQPAVSWGNHVIGSLLVCSCDAVFTVPCSDALTLWPPVDHSTAAPPDGTCFVTLMLGEITHTTSMMLEV